MFQRPKKKNHHPGNDYGDAKADHHPYHRGAMSDDQPYNEYNPRADQRIGSESLQSYGRGYGADNSYPSGFNATKVFGPAPHDHSYAANPGPAVDRSQYYDQTRWDQENGTWKSLSEFHSSPLELGKHV